MLCSTKQKVKGSHQRLPRALVVKGRLCGQADSLGLRLSHVLHALLQALLWEDLSYRLFSPLKCQEEQRQR